MKIFFMCAVVLFTTVNCFSQVAKIKGIQKKTDTTQRAMTSNTVLPKNNNSIPAASQNTNTEKAKPNTEITKTPAETKKNNIVVVKETKVAVPDDMSKASLLDAFIYVSTGTTHILGTGINDNKDPDTHWSCGIFDQSDRPITSFHDDSNSDEYPSGYITPALKMHIDNAANFGDFSNGGRLHINIAPNGHDTWNISQFVIVLDFQNPRIAQRINWNNISLSQDKRDIDLSFYYDGKNFRPRNDPGPKIPHQ